MQGEERGSLVQYRNINLVENVHELLANINKGQVNLTQNILNEKVQENSHGRGNIRR